MNPTPRPWRLDRYNMGCAVISKQQPENADPFNDACIECHSASGGELENKANAALIVQAVNSFDAMREALRKIADEPCNHGPQEFCPREIAKVALQENVYALHVR